MDRILFFEHARKDQPFLPSSFLLNFASNDGTDLNNMHNVPKTWTSLMREYSMWILERRKSSLPISRSQEIFLAEMPLLLSAIASILVMHGKLGSSAVEFLAVIGIMDPKLGVPLLLTILFYTNIFSGTGKDTNFHDMLLKLLGMLPSLASHPVMTPFIVQTILPMMTPAKKKVRWIYSLPRVVSKLLILGHVMLHQIPDNYPEVDPSMENEEALGTDGMDGFLSDLANAIPGIDEAMSFAEMLKNTTVILTLI